MKNILEFIKRHLSWFLLGLVSVLALAPGAAEFKTLRWSEQ